MYKNIDEAIEEFRECYRQNMADLDITFAEENMQIVNWLIELRDLKKNSFSVVSVDTKSYNKAIEEFAEKCNQKITEFVLEHKDQLDFASGVSVAWNIIDEIAESMKGEKE